MNISTSIHDTPRDESLETHLQSELNIELYSAGFVDGVTGLKAQLPHFKDYWDGYALGCREYCCGLLGVKILSEEIPPEKLAILMTA